MDPIAAVGVAGNAGQFIDFLAMIISKTVEIYQSADGSLAETTELASTAQRLAHLSKTLEMQPGPSPQGHKLAQLCRECQGVARELQDALLKLQVQGNCTKWQSLRKALRSAWRKDKVHELEARVARFREKINVFVIVELR